MADDMEGREGGGDPSEQFKRPEDRIETWQEKEARWERKDQEARRRNEAREFSLLPVDPEDAWAAADAAVESVVQRRKDNNRKAAITVAAGMAIVALLAGGVKGYQYFDSGGVETTPIPPQAGRASEPTTTAGGLALAETPTPTKTVTPRLVETPTATPVIIARPFDITPEEWNKLTAGQKKEEADRANRITKNADIEAGRATPAPPTLENGATPRVTREQIEEAKESASKPPVRPDEDKDEPITGVPAVDNVLNTVKNWIEGGAYILASIGVAGLIYLLWRNKWRILVLPFKLVGNALRFIGRVITSPFRGGPPAGGGTGGGGGGNPFGIGNP